MKETYAVLALIIVMVSVVYAIWGAQAGVVADFAPGLATEVVGILVTLVFVQRILDRRQAADRARASRGGIRRAETPLRDLAHLWSAVIKGSLPQSPTRPPRTYRALFNSEWAGWIDQADLTGVRYAWNGETWLESIARVIRLSRHRLSEIIEVYSVHMDVALVEALDELRDDPYLARVEAMGEELRALRGEMALEIRPEEFSLGRSGPERARMMRTLLRALDLYNDGGLVEGAIDAVPETFWRAQSIAETHGEA